MSKLYFRFSAMNAGKSTALLQVAHNYAERGINTLLLTSSLDTREGVGVISSRLGISSPAFVVNPSDSVIAVINQILGVSDNYLSKIGCVLVDESQFFTADQITDLHKFAHLNKVPVICYGIRTDFRGALFEGSSRLLAIADSLDELKTVCRCGKKATFNVRLDDKFNIIREGSQVKIGGNSTYESVCPIRFYTGHCE